MVNRQLCIANAFEDLIQEKTPRFHHFVRYIYDKYGYRGNPDTGYVWEIDLNPNACWEDGTPINADTYVQSMERLLNPSLVNYRADGWYANGVVLANAERYYKQGRKTLDECYKFIDNSSGEYTDATFAQDGKYYINIAKPISNLVLYIFSA